MSQFFFKLFACCIPVKGFKISIICDLQRSSYAYIPPILEKILTEYKHLCLEDLHKLYPENKNDINQYFEYLIAKDFGFLTDTPENFPELSLDYERPEFINNAIIDNSRNSKHNYELLFKELDILACKFIELRFFDSFTYNEIIEVLNFSKNYRFVNITLLLKFDDTLLPSLLEELFLNFGNVGSIIVHSTPEDSDNILLGDVPFSYIAQNISSDDCCGKISMKYFSINIDTFTEAYNFNSCLNKKIGIDERGNIKNCPSMKRIFGNSSKDSLIKIVEQSKFKEIWKLKKDDILICKDCQFRYICTDCRAFLENPLSKPLKCNYDPYTNVWN